MRGCGRFQAKNMNLNKVKTEDGKEEEGKVGGPSAKTEEEIKEALPFFLRPENIRDDNGKRPGDEGYDECSLLIPKQCWSEFTPAMTQYWKIKKDNNEKILFFKLGKFYEIFYNDAVICHRILDLNWMGARKLHVGFPEKALTKYLSILVGHGFKVAVIE